MSHKRDDALLKSRRLTDEQRALAQGHVEVARRIVGGLLKKGYLPAIILGREEAEGEALLALCRCASYFDLAHKAGSFTGYLYRAIKTALATRGKRQRFEKKRLGFYPEDVPETGHQADGYNPDRLLAPLTTPERRLLRMLLVDDGTNRERHRLALAESPGASRFALYRRYRRALKKLRSHWRTRILAELSMANDAP